MAGKIELKIGANTTDIRRSLVDLSRSMKSTMGKSQISLISEDTKKFLKNEMKTQMETLSRRTSDLSKRAEVYANALKKGVDNTQKEIKYKQRLLQITNQLSKVEGQRAEISMGQGALSGGGKGGMLGGLLGKFAKNPLTYGIMAGFGAYRLGKAAFGAYEGTIPSRIGLMGRGVRDLNVSDMRFAKLGMGAEDVLSARRSAMDVYGRGGATQEAIRRRALFERAQGLESGTLSGLGAQLRPSMGTANADEATTKIMAAQLASGIDDAIGPYLETTANMLTELNKNGFTLDNEALAALNAFIGLSGGKQSERMGRVLMGIDAAVRGSTGETNAFMQMAAASAGLGGGTVGGLQAVLKSGGMFGVDVNKYGNTLSPGQKEALQYMGLGQSGHFGKMARGITGVVDRQFGTPEELSRLDERSRANLRVGKGRFYMRMGMAQDEIGGMQVDTLLRQAATAGPKEKKRIEKELKDLKGKTPEDAYKNWEAIQKSSENLYEELQTQTKLLMVLAGEKLLPIATLKDQAKVALGESAAIAAGIITPSESEVKENQRKRLKTISKREFTGRERMLGLGGLPETPKKSQEQVKKDLQEATKMSPEIFQTALENVLGNRLDKLLKETKMNKKSTR